MILTTGKHTNFKANEHKILSVINSCKNYEQVQTCENWVRRLDPDPEVMDETYAAYIAGVLRMKKFSLGGYDESK